MTSHSSRAEYAKRMHRALEYIDRNLDRSLDLAELADVAHFSAFHFHRVFAAWMAETLGEYLRRRRLEVAALRRAAQPKLPVLSIALSVGFDSTEAFARAFKGSSGARPRHGAGVTPRDVLKGGTWMAIPISRFAIRIRRREALSVRVQPPRCQPWRIL